MVIRLLNTLYKKRRFLGVFLLQEAGDTIADLFMQPGVEGLKAKIKKFETLNHWKSSD